MNTIWTSVFLIINDVTCWMKSTRRWFYQAFHIYISLDFRAVGLWHVFPEYTRRCGNCSPSDWATTAPLCSQHKTLAVSHTTWDICCGSLDWATTAQQHKINITSPCVPGLRAHIASIKHCPGMISRAGILSLYELKMDAGDMAREPVTHTNIVSLSHCITIHCEHRHH